MATLCAPGVIGGRLRKPGKLSPDLQAALDKRGIEHTAPIVRIRRVQTWPA